MAHITMYPTIQRSTNKLWVAGKSPLDKQEKRGESENAPDDLTGLNILGASYPGAQDST